MRSGHIPKVKAKVAGAIKELFNKKAWKSTQKKVIESLPSEESMTEVRMN